MEGFSMDCCVCRYSLSLSFISMHLSSIKKKKTQLNHLDYVSLAAESHLVMDIS